MAGPVANGPPTAAVAMLPLGGARAVRRAARVPTVTGGCRVTASAASPMDLPPCHELDGQFGSMAENDLTAEDAEVRRGREARTVFLPPRTSASSAVDSIGLPPKAARGSCICCG